jgi:hypothetical protein
MVRPAAAQSPPRPSLSGGPPDIRRCRWNEHPGAQSREAPIAAWAGEFPGRTEKEIRKALNYRSERGVLKERRTALRSQLKALQKAPAKENRVEKEKNKSKVLKPEKNKPKVQKPGRRRSGPLQAYERNLERLKRSERGPAVLSADWGARFLSGPFLDPKSAVGFQVI